MKIDVPEAPKQPDTTGLKIEKPLLPVATILMLVVNVTSIALRIGNSGLLEKFNRNPTALAAGEWWRLLTPMLIDPDPYWTIALKLLGLAVIGTAVERVMGGVRWLIIYFVAGLIGEIAGYAWDPNSAGFSLPLFGLMGALFFLMLSARPPMSILAAILALGFVASVAGQAMHSIVLILLFGILIGAFGWFVRRNLANLQSISRWVGAIGLVSAVLLILLGDIHGPALITGAILAAALYDRKHGSFSTPTG